MCDLNKNPIINKINHKNKSFNSFITNTIILIFKICPLPRDQILAGCLESDSNPGPLNQQADTLSPRLTQIGTAVRGIYGGG